MRVNRIEEKKVCEGELIFREPTYPEQASQSKDKKENLKLVVYPSGGSVWELRYKVSIPAFSEGRGGGRNKNSGLCSGNRDAGHGNCRTIAVNN
jgi:hypothetical protein